MNNKEFDARMQGMRYAYEIAKAEGVDGLEKEIKRRNISGIPFTSSKAEAKALWDRLSQNLYNNITMTFLYCLTETFDLGDEEIKTLCKEYQKLIVACTDMDYMGEHYVKLEDYAIELKQRCDIDIDVNRIAACQDYYDEHNEASQYGRVDLKRLIEVLEENNYLAAAQFLRKKGENI